MKCYGRYNGDIMNREDIFERLKVLIIEKFSVQEGDILISSKFSDFDGKIDRTATSG